MNKLAKFTFLGANQDITQSKHPNTFYYDAEHIKIMATSAQSTGSVSNEKGTLLVIDLPDLTINDSLSRIEYGANTLSYRGGGEISTQITSGSLPTTSTSQKIIGAIPSRTGIIVFSTDSLGFDCIWEIDNVINNDYTLELIYCRSLGFSIDNPIQGIYNYENVNIQKVYWVDGKAQIRFINTRHGDIEDNGNLIDVPSTSIDFVGTVDFSQPVVTDVVGGGTHTSGMIQYAYNLYRLNSSQTKLSPLSNLVPLAVNGNKGGGDLNQVVSSTPIVKISELDLSYTNIKVYAIKYTSLNELPSISLIEDRDLDSADLTIFDTGNTIASLTLEEFLLLGSEPYIPKHIETKDNRLFLANIETNAFILPDELDCRAYSFNLAGFARVSNNIRLNTNNIPIGDNRNVSSTTWVLDKNHDAVNLNYDAWKYQSNSTTLGGEGKFIKYALEQKTAAQLGGDPEDFAFFKDREIYRIGIVFYNVLGQESLPQWIADFKAPEGNLEGNYNTLKVEFKAAFYTWLNTFNFKSESNKPVGYKIVRAQRSNNDRTILTQGVLNGMMVNVPRNSRNAALFNTSEKRANGDSNPKLPNFIMRTFDVVNPLQPNSHLLNMQFRNNNPSTISGDGGTQNRQTEIQYDSGERRADTFQYTVMQQMYSPDLFFNNLPFSPNLQLKVKGGALRQSDNVWVQDRNVNTKLAERAIKGLNGIHPFYATTRNPILGNPEFIMDRGLINNSNARDEERNVEFTQWYRDYRGYKKAGSNGAIYKIYGTPEPTGRGQGRTIYNKDAKYEYSNTLEGFLSDGEDDFKQVQQGVISLNTFGSKCLTMVLDDRSNIDSHQRPTLEQVYSSSLINDTSALIIGEITKPINDTYLGNLYGGSTYEEKKRTTYSQIGNYNDIDVSTVTILSPGDTYVQDFTFLRMGKTDTEIYQYNIPQFSEIVSVKLETSVDLKNRNDISSSAWDSRFQPRDEEYHKYNTVYSQQSNLITSRGLEFTNRRIEQFDTRIQSTKLKSPNEVIDSFTDILVNERMDLDGKFGPINSIVEFNGNIYAFQDEAIAAISINPRIQVQGNDGVGLELGTGGILYDYNYLTTKSGSVNKWGIVPAKRGIYYYDALNKGLGRVPDALNPLLTDVKGMHSFFNRNYDFDALQVDNPLKNTGAVLGYDNYNNDIFVTLLQGDQSFTWVYNELQDQFIDRKLYLPSKYIYKGEKLLSVSNDSTQAYEHYTGPYNTYHGVNRPSTITIQVNPDSDVDTVFNNIYYNSEIYLADIDQPNKTLTHITAYNEYQNSGRIPLVVGRGSNIRRKFREWKADIPRDGRNRIRNTWIFLKLELENTSNYRMVLHDIIVSYTI